MAFRILHPSLEPMVNPIVIAMVAISLTACTKNKDERKSDLQPVSQAESEVIQNSLRNGNPPLPNAPSTAQAPAAPVAPVAPTTTATPPSASGAPVTARERDVTHSPNPLQDRSRRGATSFIDDALRGLRPGHPTGSAPSGASLALSPLVDSTLISRQAAVLSRLTPECQRFVQTLPANYRFDLLSVPEDWSQPAGAKIDVFFYGEFPSSTTATSGAPTSGTPTVFFNGGPSGSSHGSFASIAPIARSQQMPFIFIDQRGTGCSTPYPSGVTAQNVARLSKWGSRSIVLDAEQIRKHVFSDARRWKVFGQSYGGHIAHRYLTVAPEGMLAGFAHGFAVEDDPVVGLVARQRAQKRLATEFFVEYPSLLGKVQTARAKIANDRCFTDQVTEVCGPAVLDGAIALLGFNNAWPRLSQWLDALITEEGQLNDEVLEQFTRNFVFGVFAANALSQNVLSAVDMMGAGDEAICSATLQRLTQAGEDIASWPFSECRLIVALKNEALKQALLNVESFKDLISIRSISTALSTNPDLKFFLYSGQKDAFVPVESFDPEIQALGTRITYRSFPNSGHEGFLTESQIWTDLLSINEPSGPTVRTTRPAPEGAAPTLNSRTLRLLSPRHKRLQPLVHRFLRDSNITTARPNLGN